jgi:hypothetical protein
MDIVLIAPLNLEATKTKPHALMMLPTAQLLLFWIVLVNVRRHAHLCKELIQSVLLVLMTQLLALMIM